MSELHEFMTRFVRIQEWLFSLSKAHMTPEDAADGLNKASKSFDGMAKRRKTQS